MKDTVSVTFYLTKEIYKRLKSLAAVSGKTIKKTIEDLIHEKIKISKTN
jgi:hypothetical protein